MLKEFEAYSLDFFRILYFFSPEKILKKLCKFLSLFSLMSALYYQRGKSGNCNFFLFPAYFFVEKHLPFSCML